MISETLQHAAALRDDVRRWVLQGFTPQYGRLRQRFQPDARWQAVADTGTELWLDTGDIAGIQKAWTQEFRALTTNNTLLNQEVQRGQYDDLVKRTAAHLRKLAPAIPEAVLRLEVAFVLNAWHGLRLVEQFDAMVSVEEHTDLAHDIELAVLYGERFHEICPERFIVKVPLTPAGLLAMRGLRQRRVPVNFTLGFSARQNYLAARVGNPTWVNVFLGRLNALVADSGLGSGDGVGERATAASQEAIAGLRQSGAAETRQIAASMRSGAQVWTLAGTDVMTIPLSVAQQYHADHRPPPASRGPRAAAIEPQMDAGARRELHFDRLWDVSPAFRSAVEALAESDLDHASGADLVATLRRHGAPDVFPEYTPADIETFRRDGKLPKLGTWQSRLASGAVSIDSLLNMSGLYSFSADQAALDARVRGLIG